MSRGAPILPHSRGLTALLFATAFMAFAAACALGAAMGAAQDVAQWNDRVFNRLTVQIMPSGAMPSPEEVTAALDVLKHTPGVVSADVMSAAENAALIAPWIKPGEAASGLPFPALIDVRLGSADAVDIGGLKTRLVTSAPHAVIDDHRQVIASSGIAPAESFWMALLVILVSTFSFAVTFTAALRSRILVQEQNVALLRLLGASDARLSAWLGRSANLTAIAGATVGTAGAAGLFLLRAHPALAGLPAMVPALSSAELPWLAIVPVSAAIIAGVTGRFLIMPALRRW